jgi:3-hydroxybutyryl-CoA dehydratase
VKTPPVGTRLGPLVIPSVDAAAMKDLAVLLADPNPIHLDAEAARAAGLGDRPVNQGPANFGYVLTMLGHAVPRAAIVEFRVRLLANVFAGDRVIAEGRVDATQEIEGTERLVCSVWLDVDGGERAVDGSAILALPYQPKTTPETS